MLGPEMRRHLGRREPAVDVAGVSEAEQVIEQRARAGSPRCGSRCTLVLPWRLDSGAPSAPDQQADMAVAAGGAASSASSSISWRGVLVR